MTVRVRRWARPWGSLRALLAGATALVCQPAHAGSIFIATLSGGNESPPNALPYGGTGFLILNDAESQATISGTHSISAPVIAGYIQRGAAGLNGPIAFVLPGSSPLGPLAWSISQGDVANLKAGGLYMNFATPTNPTGAIRGNFSRYSFVPSAINSAQASVAGALDVSAGYSADFNGLLTQTALAPAINHAFTLFELSGRTLYVQSREQIESLADTNDTLLDIPAGPGFHAVARGGKSFGKRNATADQTGATISRPFVTGALAYGFESGASLGVGVGYADAEDTFPGGEGMSKTATTGAHIFATSAVGSLSLSAAAGYGWNTITTTRVITSLARTATAATHGHVWGGAIKLARPIDLDNDASLAPYARFDGQSATIDPYAETGAGAVSLVVPARTMSSAALEVGAGLTVPMPIGAHTITAHVEAGWRHMLVDGSGAFATGFAGSPALFDTRVIGAKRDFAHGQVSLMADVTDRLSFGLGYRGLASTLMTSHTLEARFALRL